MWLTGYVSDLHRFSQSLCLFVPPTVKCSPHYRLKGATQALKAGLEEEGFIHLYKNVDTPDFTQEIVKQFHNNWFFINEDQVVRENQEKVGKLEYQKKFQ